MRNPGQPRWQWNRIDAAPPTGPRFARHAAEPVGPDGIRWGLVARVKAEIEAGTYDSPDIWAAAEAKLFARWDNAE